MGIKSLIKKMVKDSQILKRIIIFFYDVLYEKKDEHELRKIAAITRCYWIFQKILGINSEAPWPVHFTSRVGPIEKIKVGKNTSPGFQPCQYIQAMNGIIFGDNVHIGPGVGIISANHDPKNLDRHLKAPPIKIGNNVWIGMNSVILPGVKIGDNVIIGAGSVVTKDLPNNCVAAGNPAKVIKKL